MSVYLVDLPDRWDIAIMEPVEGGKYHVKIYSDRTTGGGPGYTRRSGYGETWQEALEEAIEKVRQDQ